MNLVITFCTRKSPIFYLKHSLNNNKQNLKPKVNTINFRSKRLFVENPFEIIREHLREHKILLTDNGKYLFDFDPSSSKNPEHLVNMVTHDNAQKILRDLFDYKMNDKIILPKVKIGDFEVRLNRVLGYGGTKIIFEGEILTGTTKGTKLALSFPNVTKPGSWIGQSLREPISTFRLREAGLYVNDFEEMSIAKVGKEEIELPILITKPFKKHEVEIYDAKNGCENHRFTRTKQNPPFKDTDDIEELYKICSGFIEDIKILTKNGLSFGADSMNICKLPDGTLRLWLMDLPSIIQFKDTKNPKNFAKNRTIQTLEALVSSSSQNHLPFPKKFNKLYNEGIEWGASGDGLIPNSKLEILVNRLLEESLK